jgi:SAM-dependent methyltransferase
MTSGREYVMAGTEAGTESERLALLEAARDPGTMRRLDGLGVKSGWSCLEVGAGRGSIARRLADLVGPTGTVVAADIDTRFLTGMPDNVEVRRVDIRTDELEPGRYDLVHCRAFLMHMPDADDTIARLAAALKPGGLLLAEEGDYGLYHFGGHPDADELNQASRATLDAITNLGVFNASFGRSLPGRLVAAGLTLAGAEIGTAVSRPGDPGFAFAKASALDGAPRLIAAGILDDAAVARLDDFFGRPDAIVTGPSLVAAWGQKPETVA